MMTSVSARSDFDLDLEAAKQQVARGGRARLNLLRKFVLSTPVVVRTVSVCDRVVYRLTKPSRA